jgi:transposase
METNRFKLVAVATANKSARIAFALMRNEAHYADTPA